MQASPRKGEACPWDTGCVLAPGVAGQSQDGVDRDSYEGPDARAEAKVKASDISKIDSIGKNSSEAILGPVIRIMACLRDVRNGYAVTEE
jgi:hypothetical protein